MYIVEDHRLAVPDLDPGDERINETLPEGGVVHISIAEGTKPRPDHLTGEPGLFHFCPLYLQDQIRLLGLQLRQTPGKAPRSGALLDGVQDIPLALPVRVQLLPVCCGRVRCLVPLLDLQDPRGELPDHVIGQHVLDGRLDDAVLEVVPGDRLQLARLPALLRPAFIIVIHPPGFTGAGLAVQHGPTIGAEAFTAQQIVHLCPPRRVVTARFEMFGRLLEGLPVDDGLRLELDTLDLKAAEVLLVPQHPIDHGLADGPATLASDPALPEELDQLLRRGAGVMQPERLADHGGLLLVDDNVPVLVYLVPDRERLATVQALLRGLPHAPDDLLPEVGGVVLGQALQDALQDNPLRAFRDGLLGVQQADACLLQLSFTDRYVLPVTAEAVDLPNDDTLEAALLRVVQHPLELIPADDALPGYMPVGVHLDDLDPVSLSIGPAVSDLALDGLIRLVRPG